MCIFAKKMHHSSLSELLLYNEVMNQPTTTMTTRPQTRGIPATFQTNSTQQYHNSFPLRTIRDLKGQSEQTVSYSVNTGLTPTAKRQHHTYRTCTEEYRPDWINKKCYKWLNLLNTVVFP